MDWNWKILLCVGLFAGSGSFALGQSTPPTSRNQDGPDSVLSLEWVIGEVQRNHPALKSARANWEALKARVPQARAWEDLRVGLDIERMGTTRFDTFTDNEWMVAQALPLSGKNRKRAQAAAAEAIAAFEEWRRRELDLTARAKTAYYRYANAHLQLDINRKNADLLRQLVEISRVKYEVGKQSQAAVLTAETDLAKLTESRFDLERQISEGQTQLNVLMNRPAQAALERPTGLAFLPAHLAGDALQSSAQAHRPELLVARQKIIAAQARLELAKRSWIPDPELRVEVRQFNGGGGFQEYDTGLFFNFPWLNRSKYKAAIEEAKYSLASARYDLETAQRETTGLIRDQLTKITTFHHHYELFRDRVVPLAQQTVRANQAAYETDKTGILELILARRTVQQVESMLWTHLADYLTAVAELEAIIGADPNQKSAAPPHPHNANTHDK